ncbi:muellerian-inhibiting factor [Discoglossus pictus]
MVQGLPSKVGKKGKGWAEGEHWRSVPSMKEELPQPHHHDKTEIGIDLQRPKCGVEVSRGARLGWSNLETQGDFRDYETSFLDALRKSSWEAGDLELFGICPNEEHTGLGAMKNLAGLMEEPHGKHLMVLQQDSVEWETGASLQFQGTVQEHIAPLLHHLHFLILVFYPTPSVHHHGSKFLASGEGIPQGQVVCMALNTRYLVFRVGGSVRSLSEGDLRLQLSVQMRTHSDGPALPDAEAQQLLYGTDNKCLTKITPVLFMVVGQSGQPAALPPILQYKQLQPGPSPQGGLDGEKKDEFLETLSHFSKLLLNSHGKATSTIHLPLDPSDDSFGDLRPHLFNVTEAEALEWLVESEEPLMFLFLPGSKSLLGIRALQGKLTEKLLETITKKLDEVLEDLEEVLTSGGHIPTLRRLLRSCHGSFNISYLPTINDTPELGKKQNTNLHSLMLLKALQTVHTYWQDRKKLSRQNRGTSVKPYCRLQELTINLKPYAEYKDVHFPEEININNCVGPCRFPQTTQSDYQAHVVLLIQLQERKQPSLERLPCCVPVRYQEQWLMVVDENGLRLQIYPNMVAKECGCR